MKIRRIKTEQEAARFFANKLRVASRRPNIYGYQPHDKQMLFHSSPARGKLFVGGNRSGKTVGGATETVWRALGEHPYIGVKPPPTFWRVVTVDIEEGIKKVVLPEIARWLPPSALKGGSWDESYDAQGRTLYLDNGSFIEFMTHEQKLEAFAGTSRDGCWFDEEPPQLIFNECMMRLVDTEGSYWITMTPLEGQTWTYDEIFEKADPNHKDYNPDLFVIEVDQEDNPHLNLGEMMVLLVGQDEDDIKARRHGQYTPRGGLIYPNFNPTMHVIDPIHPKQFNPENWLHFAMMDQGIAAPTAWLWAAIDRAGRMVVYDEYYKSGEVVKAHAVEVLTRESQHGIEPSYRVGDPSIKHRDPITGTSVQIEYVDNGVPIILGNNDFVAGSNVVRTKLGDAYIPQTLWICKNCEMLPWEMKRYRFALWPNRKMDRDKNPKEEPHKKNDHACDALRYGVASRPMKEDFSVPEDYSRNLIVSSVSPYSPRTDPGVDPAVQAALSDDMLGSEW